jgi:hypothetical protein
LTESRGLASRAAGFCASVAIKDVISWEPFCASTSNEALVSSCTWG